MEDLSEDEVIRNVKEKIEYLNKESDMNSELERLKNILSRVLEDYNSYKSNVTLEESERQQNLGIIEYNIFDMYRLLEDINTVEEKAAQDAAELEALMAEHGLSFAMLDHRKFLGIAPVADHVGHESSFFSDRIGRNP